MLDNYFVENFLYVVTSRADASLDNLEFWGFQGCGVYDKSFVDSNQSLFDAWLGSSNRTDYVNSYGRNFRGAGIAYIRDQKSGCFYILPDLLGEAILYKYECNGIVIISGDLLEIERISKLIQ